LSDPPPDREMCASRLFSQLIDGLRGEIVKPINPRS